MDILSINVIDVCLVLLVLLAGVVGFKRGVFKELVLTIGFYILLFISFIIKTPIGEWMGLYLPFFDFGGPLKGYVTLNIILYHIIAFILVFAVLGIIFSVIVTVTKILEKILDATILLGLVSKILGFFVGLLEGYVIIFLLCIFLQFPIFNQTVVADSKLKDKVLYNTPVLSNYTSSLVNTVTDTVDLVNKSKDMDKDEFNLQVVKIMLDNKMTTKKYITNLKWQNKLDVPGLQELLDNYS